MAVCISSQLLMYLLLMLTEFNYEVCMLPGHH